MKGFKNFKKISLLSAPKVCISLHSLLEGNKLSMNVFFATDIGEEKIILTDQEAQHCMKVLRKSRGEMIHVIDGQGTRFVCEIVDHDRRTVELKIKSKIFEKIDPFLPHIVFGMIKNQTRLEWMLEKVTEIGVGRITPLICTRSEKRTIKRERLEKIILSATKQSLNPYLPILDDPVKAMDFQCSLDATARYIASYGEGIPELHVTLVPQSTPVILIGPEGDFTADELAHFVDVGYQRVNLGKSRLRAETACMVSCTLLRNA